MAIFLYHIFLWVYSTGIRLAALWNPKARRWVNGRRRFPAATPHTGPTLWMHCASLGEFEQGRPVLEALKTQYPQCRIILTFFSPSGYEQQKQYTGADHVFYLPADGPANASRFIEMIQPALVIWVKYDYWYYYLSCLHQQQIPVLLISAVFRKGQPFFTAYGGFWRRMLGCFAALFVQTEAAAQLLASAGINKPVIVGGDTRFDRVLTIAASPEAVPGIAEFCGQHPVIVAGSTWEEDEAEWVHYINIHPAVRFIIAPHEIDNANLKDVQQTFAGAVFYSDWIKGVAAADGPSPHVLIIDNVGILSRLYQYATITYVGGGFGSDGVHNVLEAAVYNKPVFFGPVYSKYVEAVALVETGGAFSIDNALQLEKELTRLFNNPQALAAAGCAAGDYVRSNAGATAAVVQYIQENRLLIN